MQRLWPQFGRAVRTCYHIAAYCSHHAPGDVPLTRSVRPTLIRRLNTSFVRTGRTPLHRPPHTILHLVGNAHPSCWRVEGIFKTDGVLFVKSPICPKRQKFCLVIARGRSRGVCGGQGRHRLHYKSPRKGHWRDIALKNNLSTLYLWFNICRLRVTIPSIAVG